MTNAIICILLVHMLARTSRLRDWSKGKGYKKNDNVDQRVFSHLSSECKSAADGETESSTQSRDAKAAGGAVERIVRAV